MLAKYPKTRLALYLASVALMAASFFAASFEWPIETALVQTATLISGVAGVTAATNTHTRKDEPVVTDYAG